MLGKAKKTVSLAYKEKLISDIAYYEKRIEEALRMKKRNSFDGVESSDDESNPYTLNISPSSFELKQQEGDLSNRASMTLELAMLTIMQSEVSIMVTVPDVRRPVKEDGTWLEVAAECRIDLVSFNITFYAHKPYRKFAPTRFRSVLVTLIKPAHEKELAKSVLSKQNRPNLALQVLQSYATAFRSRRTTLLELAKTYASHLKMEALPEGGYCVKFLDLLTVEWTLENMWSPIVPFCHRMKFEVEYMPKEYIHAIGKLYKQFKDPSLETSERTEVLSRIFDTCLEARGPARDLQESFESDPETTGRLHERRTTIDQEPEVPPSHVPASPKKLSKGEENKAQNLKTNMAPPITIPKKVKKVANDKKIPNVGAVASDNRADVSRKTKTNEVNGTREAKKSKPNNTKDTIENRRGVKRVMENDQNSNAKKIRTNDQSANSNKSAVKAGSQADVARDNSDSSSRTLPSVTSKGIKTVAGSKNLKNNEIADTTKAKRATKIINPKNKDPKGNVGSSQNVAQNRRDAESVARFETEGSVAGSKNSNKKVDAKNNADLKKINPEGSMASAKNSTKKVSGERVANSNDRASKDDDDDGRVYSNTEVEERHVSGSKTAENCVSAKKIINKGNAKQVDKNVEGSKIGKASRMATTKTNNERIGDGTSIANSKKVERDKNIALSKNSKDINVERVASSKSGTKKTVDNIANVATNVKAHANKSNNNKTGQRNSNNDPKPKNTGKVPFKENNISDQIAEDDDDKVTKQKETNKMSDKNKIGINNTHVNNQRADKLGNKDNAVDNKTARVVPKTDRNYKVIGENKMEGNVQGNNKNNPTKPQSEPLNKLNNENDKKLTTVNKDITKTVLHKMTAGHKAKNPIKNDANEKLNRNEMVKNVADSNKDTFKSVTTTKSNTQRNDNATKVQNINPKATLLNKQTGANILKKQTKQNTFQKFQDNQSKIAQKLKTKIPMLKSKITISSLSEKLKGVEKMKKPMKSLPVFKKVVKNVPTRISPRKFPTALRPSSHGFFNK